jgi:hypothetical protein
MKKILVLFAILLIIIGGVYLAQNYLKEGKIGSSPTANVIIGNHTFKVSEAVSQQEQEIGLSETGSISQDQGMIFLFKAPAYYSFWMKDMKFPIDIIYIKEDTIVTIKSNAQPPKNASGNLIIYTPTDPADKVLEIQAGLSQKYNFKNGDKVKYENLSN